MSPSSFGMTPEVSSRFASGLEVPDPTQLQQSSRSAPKNPGQNGEVVAGPIDASHRRPVERPDALITGETKRNDDPSPEGERGETRSVASRDAAHSARLNETFNKARTSQTKVQVAERQTELERASGSRRHPGAGTPPLNQRTRTAGSLKQPAALVVGNAPLDGTVDVVLHGDVRVPPIPEGGPSRRSVRPPAATRQSSPEIAPRDSSPEASIESRGAQARGHAATYESGAETGRQLRPVEKPSTGKAPPAEPAREAGIHIGRIDVVVTELPGQRAAARKPVADRNATGYSSRLYLRKV